MSYESLKHTAFTKYTDHFADILYQVFSYIGRNLGDNTSFIYTIKTQQVEFCVTLCFSSLPSSLH